MATDFDDGQDTPVESNALARAHATDKAREAIENLTQAIAEDLAVSGPADGDREVTPTLLIENACKICQLHIMLWLADPVPAPRTRKGAWSMIRCCGTRGGGWSWCPIKGVLIVGEVTRNLNRRVTPGRPPAGIAERRRTPR